MTRNAIIKAINACISQLMEKRKAEKAKRAAGIEPEKKAKRGSSGR